MTQKLEEALNLPKLSDALKAMEDDDENAKHKKEQEELQEEAYDILNNIDKTLEFNKNLEELNKEDLVGNDKELKDVYQKALVSFENLTDLAVNVDVKYSGQLLVPAIQSLKVALDVQNSRTDKKLKMIKINMEMEKIKLEAERNAMAKRRLDIEERKVSSNTQEMDVIEATDGSFNTETNKMLDMLRKVMKDEN